MDQELTSNIVCDSCSVANLVQPVMLATCANCKSIYCAHNTSTNDPQYCKNCLRDTTITITEPTRNLKVVNYSGADWLFTSRRIHTMADNELQIAIEYHWAILHTMLAERDERRREAFKKSVIKIANFKPSQLPLDMHGMPAAKQIKAPKVKKTKNQGDIAKKLVADLLKQGFTAQQLIDLAATK